MLMAYAAVTSLMETLSLHFLQSQPRLPLHDLEAQMRDGNENLGLLQQILEDMAVEVDKASGSSNGNENLRCIKACLPSRLHGVKQTEYYPKKKKMIKSEKQLAESSSQNERIANAGDSILLSSRLREVGEVKQKMVSLHQNLGFLQESLEKSEICYDNAGAMKDVEAEMRDVLFKAEERIEMELTTIYLAKDTRLHITACVLRLHEIFIEAEKQTDYLKNELMIRTQNETITDDASLFGRMRRRGLLLVKGLAHKNTTVSKFSKSASNLDNRMVGCHEVFMTILDKLMQQSTKGRQVVSIVGMRGIGKTTLAHKLYEDPSVTSYFDKRAWVTVS
ncbi:PREDICTED: probable disease resistance protein At1g58390 [Ipomoea nil]|uniref:probable disease resistance protein At1g58390 n=1 Tax=Ipomoea nil TaxID=35883 RepID=UPI0009011B05|nr:PREDICTED: probable disease resistance protein At1g58390 [Ipomoea nil]